MQRNCAPGMEATLPQALIPAIAATLGGGLVATVAATAVVVAGTYFVSDLLRGGPPKPDASERELKSPKPPRIHVLGRRRVHGSSMLYINTSESETVDVWAYCEGPINGVVATYLNDSPVTITGGVVQALADGAYGGGYVLAGYNLGPYPNVAHAPVVARVPAWTADHRGDGIASGYLIKSGVKASSYLDIYPQGDSAKMSLVVEGHFCHDPRNPASDPYDPATWAYTENPALHLLWFRTVFKGENYARKFAPVEQLWKDAADICDEAVPLAAGGSEPRYRAWLMFPADADPKAVESQILATFDGWTAEDENGCVKVHAGKLYSPTVSVGADQIIDYEVQEFVEDENRINETIVRHISAAHDYNEVEPEAWRDEADILARGRVVSNPLDLQVPTHTQARRIAKRTAARVNAPQRGTARVVFSARAALAERFINLTIDETGTVFFNGVAEVTGGARDHDSGGAVIEWVAVSPDADAWNPDTEEGEPAPVQAKYYLAPLAAPVVISAVAQIDASGAGARIAVTFSGSAPSGSTWFTRWRVAGDTSWLEEEQTPTASTVITGQVPVEALIEVEIATMSSDGRLSPWSLTETVDTTTALLAPLPPTELSAVSTVAGEAVVTWRNPASVNLSYVHVYRNTVNDFGTATLISGDIVGGLGQVMSVTDNGLAPGTYWWWAVAYNAASVASAPGGPATAVVT